MKLPEQFLDRMKNLLPDFDEFIQSYNQSPVKSFFVNTSQIAEQDFVKQCDWNIEKCAQGWMLLDDIKVGKTPEHHSGMIYMQELSAMMPTTFLPLNEDDWVLDLCASPGGKSIQVANRLSKGLLVSNEIVKSRANILKSNIERMGLNNVCIINNEPKDLEKCFAGVFDAVVVDAPCSGEGMFRKDENARLNWSQANVEACAIRQKAILETANKLLKQNGYLLYSTCTFSLEEDEQVVANFCSKHNYDIVEIDYEDAVKGFKIDGANTERCLRFYPHRFKGEGQFVAVLKKNESVDVGINESCYFNAISKFPTQYKLFKAFCEENLLDYGNIINNAIYNNNTIYYTSNKKIAQSGVNLVNCGVVLGEIVKGRFEPNHNFAKSFSQHFKKSVDLDETKAYKYLRGETLSCEQNGYILVKYKGVALGFGKGAGGILKNHYPKGLRNI